MAAADYAVRFRSYAQQAAAGLAELSEHLPWRGKRDRVWEAGTVMLSRLILVVGLVVAVRVATDLLSPAQLGSVAQMTSFAALFFTVLVIPVWHYIARGFLEWREAGRLTGYLWRFCGYLIGVTVVTLVIAWALQSRLRLVDGFTAPWVASLACVYLVSSALSTAGTTGFNVLNRRVPFAFFSNVPVWCGLGIAVVLFGINRRPEVWSLGQFAGLTVACGAFVVLIRQLHRERPKPPEPGAHVLPFTIARVAGFAWPVAIIGVLWWLQSQSYRFVLARIQGTASVGLFSVGYGVAAGLVATYEAVVSQFYEPIYYGDLKGQGVEGQVRAWNKYARVYIPGVIAFGVFVASSAPFLTQLLLGQRFRVAAIQVVVWAAVIESMRAISSMMYHLGIAKADNRATMIPVAAGAVLAPACVFILGRHNAFAGTAAALFIAGFAVLSIIFVTARKTLPITWPIKRMLFCGLLSTPLIAWFSAVKWLLPEPSNLATVVVLGVGGIYLLLLEGMLFSSAMKG